MNLLSTLMSEYKTEQTRRRAEAEARQAAEAERREWIKREAMHQLYIKGALTAYELAEMLDGSTTTVKGDGAYRYDVRVDCTNGFVLLIGYNVNPQDPSGRGNWGSPEIADTNDIGEPVGLKWFTDRASVRDLIGARLTGGA